MIRTGTSDLVTGVSNAHVAEVTGDAVGVGITYDTPKRLDGVSDSITVNDNVNTAIYYGDNKAAATAIAKGTMEVTISKEDMSQEQEADLLGKTINADGFVEDNVSDNPPYVALQYELTYESGAAKFVQIDKIRFQEPAAQGSSKTDNVEFQPLSLVGQAIARKFDGRRKRTRIVRGTPAVVEAARVAFFASANDNAGAIPALTLTTVPADGAAAVVVSADLTITASNQLVSASVSSANIMLIDAVGTIIECTFSLDATGKIVTISHAVDLSAATDYNLVITSGLIDVYGQGLETVSNFTTA